ncbi:MAG: hypothetical protein IH598_15185 [Bacteroidales bacterium]|nr:hypothetical protein [Bacteroidales bacterium]
MKKSIKGVLVLFGSLLLMTSCNLNPDAVTGASKPMVQNGNSLFHQTEEVSLTVGEITIEGEVKNPGKLNLEDFYKREVMVKEALYDKQKGIDFIGAYRYRGYSLFDLLHPYNHEKKNKEEFPPAIDLYVVIENAAGESVVFSWSEIFHTNIPHQMLIATEMAPIVPYKKEVNYPVSKEWKIVCGNDLFAYRMLENPVKINVHSFGEKDYAIQKGMKPMYSSDVSVVFGDGLSFVIDPVNDTTTYRTYFSSFYGMGMGYHEAKYFRGPVLFDLFDNQIDLFDSERITHGLVCFAGLDGYRSVYSFSELFNRTDQVYPILAVPENPEDGGFYRVFHPAEFYADRSVKSLQEIYFFNK